jgi:hypothetical protein
MIATNQKVVAIIATKHLFFTFYHPFLAIIATFQKPVAIIHFLFA